MRYVGRRGSALITALTVLMVVFILGSASLALGTQSMRRGRMDVLRTRALAVAEAGMEKAIHYLRTTAPDNTTTGAWRTNGLTETVTGQGSYTMVVQNGTGDNAGRVVITSTGTVSESSLQVRRALRVVLDIDLEDVSPWNNSIFGGVGQGGRSINGNVRVRGGLHLLGDGEPFTDVDGDQRWDRNEAYTDSNSNGAYDVGETFTDSDADGRRDAREPFNDINGNGDRDPPLTVTDLSSEFAGDANIGNNYSGMPSALRSLIPNPPTTEYKGETVQTLNGKLRVKHGRVDINGSATVGEVQTTGGSPAVKETMEGAFVSDGFGGSAGATQVYSDNGAKRKYNLGNLVPFPTLTEPVVKNSKSYNSYMEYLEDVGMKITGDLTLKPGTAYGPLVDAKGNSFSVDSSGNIAITGIVYVDGDIKLEKGATGSADTLRYSGRGTMVSTKSIKVNANFIPLAPTFPTVHTFGMIARRSLELATGGGASQLTLAGAFYAQESIVSVKQNELAGSFVTSYFSMQNVPHMYQIPELINNLPPGMPGGDRIWVKTLRIDSWREVAP